MAGHKWHINGICSWNFMANLWVPKCFQKRSPHLFLRSLANSLVENRVAEDPQLLLESACCGLPVPGLEALAASCPRSKLKELVLAQPACSAGWDPGVQPKPDIRTKSDQIYRLMMANGCQLILMDAKLFSHGFVS